MHWTYAIGVVIFLAIFVIRILYQYERGVVFTLGKFSHIKEPGLNFIIPIIQTMRKIDMRIKTADIPKQEEIGRASCRERV